MQIFLHFTATNLYSIIIILQLHQLLFFPIYFDMSSPIFHMTPEIAPLFLKGMGGPKQDPKGLLRLHLKFKSAAKGKPVLWSAESLAKTYGESHSTFLMKYSKFPIQEREDPDTLKNFFLVVGVTRPSVDFGLWLVGELHAELIWIFG